MHLIPVQLPVIERRGQFWQPVPHLWQPCPSFPLPPGAELGDTFLSYLGRQWHGRFHLQDYLERLKRNSFALKLFNQNFKYGVNPKPL